MIPKIIHYCWFGKAAMDNFTIECINSWKEMMPDFKIIQWNEDNCNIKEAPEFVQKAYSEKKRAFVSDYFRLKALIEYGGIYFDTDVKVVKTLSDLLYLDFFCCFESDRTLCTAVIGSCKNSALLDSFIKIYSVMRFAEKPNSFLFFDFLGLNKLKDLNINVPISLSENEKIMPFYFFSPIDFYSGKDLSNDKTYCFHFYKGTWKSSKQKVFDKIKIIVYKILGRKNYQRLKDAIKGKKDS